MPPSPRTPPAPRPASFAALTRDPAVQVVVSDLDGVLRHFDPSLWGRLDAQLGLDPGRSLTVILRSPLLAEVIRGRATHAAWQRRIRADLGALGIAEDAARAAVETWLATTPTVASEVLSILEDAAAAEAEVFVFTNGTDRVREELAGWGIDHLLGERGERLLNSAELGAAKPDPEAFERARRRVEEVLGRPVDPASIAFLDDSPGHVEAARAAGWRALVHDDAPTLP